MSVILRDEILNIMQAHTGRKNAIHGKTILALLAPMFPEQPSVELERSMRAAISEESPKDQPMICSCPQGYYLAANPAEAKKAVHYLNSYIKSLAERRTAILKHYPEAADGEQLDLGI